MTTMKAILKKYRSWLFLSEAKELDAFPLRKMEQGLCFLDLDYSQSTISHWPARQHLLRLLAMTAGAGEEGLSSDAQLRERLLSLLNFWLKGDYQNPNWWHNEIGTPRLLSSICLLLLDYLSHEQIAKAARILLRGSMKGNSAITTWTGANLLWGVLGTIGHALLTNDEGLLAVAAARAWEELRIQPGLADGIQADGSFFQHGPLVYSFGYGRDFLNDTALLLHLFSGTGYMPEEEQMRAYERFVLDGCLHLSHKGYADYMTIGREISRKDAIRLKGGDKDIGPRAALLKQTKEFKRQEELGDFCDSLDGKEVAARGVKAFPNAYMLTSHTGKSYLSAKGVHRDYLCCEAGNYENYLAYNFFDGGTVCFMADGDEYLNLSPVWNYSLIPGVTAVYESDEALHARTGDGGRWYAKRGETDLCAVLEKDGVGVLAMEICRGSIRGYCTRIALPGCMLLMGSDIACGDAGAPIVTAIDQCRFKGDNKRFPETKSLRMGESVENGGFVYTNLCDMPLHAESLREKGSWKRNNEGASEEIVEEDVFRIYFDHGTQPTNAAYAVLVAEKGAEVGVLSVSCTKGLHVAKFADGRWVSIDFNEDGCNIHVGRKP